MEKIKIAVIGGGAAGMMAAVAAAENGADVAILEPNERLGKKLNITGKGRCNITNNAELEELISAVNHNPRFLYSSLAHFGVRETMSFFESIGVKLKTERGNRVFPASDRAFDVSAALEKHLRALHVSILRERAVTIKTENARVSGILCESGNFFECGRVILTTGGVSYPATGSTGEGHRMARELGHNIVPLRPSLVPLCERGKHCSRMQGLSLRNVRLSVYDETEKKIYSAFGEMLFTHFGISGPLVLSASAHMDNFAAHRYSVEIDLKPGLDDEQLDRRIVSDFRKYVNSDFGNSLNELLPRKMIPVIVEESGIPSDLKVNEVKRAQRRRLLHVIKHFRIPISGTRPITEAIITCGGVDVSEVHPKSLESRIVGGLYFAGEILDLDARTGGYNLQIAWSTGHAAGTAAAQP